MTSQENAQQVLNEALTAEVRHLRYLQDRRAVKLSRRWWPGQMLLVNLRIKHAIRRVAAILIVHCQLVNRCPTKSTSYRAGVAGPF